MGKKRVYVESSVISYLTARPSRDVVKLARQHLTRDWWEQRDRWALYLSQTVLEEIGDGDPRAADLRMEQARTIELLATLPQANKVARHLVEKTAMPATAYVDAVHLAMAAVHGMDVLATWNQRHLDNPDLRAKVNEVLTDEGLTPAIVLTPERMLEADHA